MEREGSEMADAASWQEHEARLVEKAMAPNSDIPVPVIRYVGDGAFSLSFNSVGFTCWSWPSAAAYGKTLFARWCERNGFERLEPDTDIYVHDRGNDHVYAVIGRDEFRTGSVGYAIDRLEDWLAGNVRPAARPSVSP
jgi:hypothetical protein